MTAAERRRPSSRSPPGHVALLVLDPRTGGVHRRLAGDPLGLRLGVGDPGTAGLEVALRDGFLDGRVGRHHGVVLEGSLLEPVDALLHLDATFLDRKSTRLNSSHVAISYA